MGRTVGQVDSAEGSSASTSERIIMAAERLFGTYGIEAVSMRQITIEAGASNNSAVSYHFQNRANLVREIWVRRLPALEIARANLLKQTLDQDLGGDSYALARVLMMPSYNFVDAEGRRRYAAFLRQALRWETGRAIRHEMMGLSLSSAQAFARFRSLFLHIPEDLFAWRSLAATGLFLDLVFDRDRDIAAGLPVIPEPLFLSEAIRLLVACCGA